jgi:hypothetical protein
VTALPFAMFRIPAASRSPWLRHGPAAVTIMPGC